MEVERRERESERDREERETGGRERYIREEREREGWRGERQRDRERVGRESVFACDNGRKLDCNKKHTLPQTILPPSTSVPHTCTCSA